MPRSQRRAAIVTGAAGGIGSAIAARLDKDGVDVLAVDLASAAATYSGPGVSHAADLTTREETGTRFVPRSRRSAGSTSSSPTPASSTWRLSQTSRKTVGTLFSRSC